MEKLLSVDAALAGQRVLITGTTGFIGKVLLEKLMRDVPRLGGVVLLLRGNRAHPDAARRFHAEVLSSCGAAIRWRSMSSSAPSCASSAARSRRSASASRRRTFTSSPPKST